MSKQPTRKQFLGRLLGSAVAVGLVARGASQAKAASPSDPQASGPATVPVVKLRPDARAVARQSSSA